MTELTSSMEGLFVKDADWSKFLIKIGKYIRTESSDNVVYHNLIATAAKRITSLETGGTNAPTNQHHDPFATH